MISQIVLVITDWRSKLLESIDNDQFPSILIGNKCDCENHIDGSNVAQDLGMDAFFKTSAYTGEGIEDAIKLMITLIDQNTATVDTTNNVNDEHKPSIILPTVANQSQWKRKCC